jgi:hypothetical protein
MAATERMIRVELNELEVAAIVESLSEYLYLIEEGSLEESRSESQKQASHRALTPIEACELKNRLDSLLK